MREVCVLLVFLVRTDSRDKVNETRATHAWAAGNLAANTARFSHCNLHEV